VGQLFGGVCQLQLPFAYSFGNVHSIRFHIELLDLCVDIGQVVIQFAVACDIHSTAPVIKLVGSFGEVSVNGGGASVLRSVQIGGDREIG